MPLPRPVQIPCASTSCQNTLQKLVMKMPNNCIAQPTMKVGVKKPASSARPENALMKKTTHNCMEPIQEIVDCDSPSAVV